MHPDSSWKHRGETNVGRCLRVPLPAIQAALARRTSIVAGDQMVGDRRRLANGEMEILRDSDLCGGTLPCDVCYNRPARS